MKAYKVFDKNFKCRGFQYEVGKTYKINEEPILCERGFHACKKVSDCFNYYSFDPKNRVAEVELLGIIKGEDEDKQATNKIKIVREISWEEMLTLANSGKGNSGNSNSGDSNSGNWNSGNSNSGNWNSGNSNSGNCNSGNWNSGDRNSGDRNSGDRNSGDRNSGDRNSGNWNSGNWNSGNWNSGNWNSGGWNSGNRNSGDRNSGGWNSGNRNSGFFNSVIPDDILVFNKPCKRQVWDNCNKPHFLYFKLTEWIWFNDMTDEEKIKYPKAYVCDGYLKTYSYKEAWAKSFEKATNEDIELLKNLPNFDKDVFFEISGIMIN